VAYFALADDPEARGVRIELVNNTDIPQQQVLHDKAYINFPPVKPYSEEVILPAEAILPKGAAWIDLLDFGDLQYAHLRPSDNLVYQGWYRGEMRDLGFVNGTGISCGFGKDAGDKVF